MENASSLLDPPLKSHPASLRSMETNTTRS
jgi:hypothetical protein